MAHTMWRIKSCGINYRPHEAKKKFCLASEGKTYSHHKSLWVLLGVWPCNLLYNPLIILLCSLSTLAFTTLNRTSTSTLIIMTIVDASTNTMKSCIISRWLFWLVFEIAKLLTCRDRLSCFLFYLVEWTLMHYYVEWCW